MSRRIARFQRLVSSNEQHERIDIAAVVDSIDALQVFRNAEAMRARYKEQREKHAGTHGPVVLFFDDRHNLQLPQSHRFPMSKYDLVVNTLAHNEVVQSRALMCQARLVSRSLLFKVHDPHFVHRFEYGEMTDKEMREIGLPHSDSLWRRARMTCGGTEQGVRHALEFNTVAGAVGGGTHHAFYERGEGFCVFNDIAVACHVALEEYGVERILVVDLDVHQGNGTAVMLEDEPRVTTLDLHGENNYPFRKAKNTYDVPLPDRIMDEAYLDTLDQWLPRVMDETEPQLVLFQAGVDPLEHDTLGRLQVTRKGLHERNKRVFAACKERSVPLTVMMGGGYAKPIERSVEAHSDVFIGLVDFFADSPSM